MRKHPRLILLAICLLILLAGVLYLTLLPAKKKLLSDDSGQRGLVYCEHNRQSTQLDFYPADPEAGLVIFIHGGGWLKGSRQLSGPAAELVMQLRNQGLNVASVDYRLAPDHKLPDMLGDLNCALEYLRRRSHELGFNGQQIGFAGFSAGGHLALLAAGRHVISNLVPVQAVAAMFAPTNLSNGRQLWLEMPDDFHDKLMMQVVGAIDEGRLQRASPLFYAQYLDMPTLLVYGDRDPVVGPGQGMDMYSRLRMLGNPAEFILVRDSGHFTPLSKETSPDWYDLSKQVAAFFATYLSD